MLASTANACGRLLPSPAVVGLAPAASARGCFLPLLAVVGASSRHEWPWMLAPATPRFTGTRVTSQALPLLALVGGASMNSHSSLLLYLVQTRPLRLSRYSVPVVQT